MQYIKYYGIRYRLYVHYAHYSESYTLFTYGVAPKCSRMMTRLKHAINVQLCEVLTAQSAQKSALTYIGFEAIGYDQSETAAFASVAWP